jgi:broad specificity phosphatase PhoE
MLDRREFLSTIRYPAGAIAAGALAPALLTGGCASGLRDLHADGRDPRDIARDESGAVHTFFAEFGDGKSPGGESLGDAVERMLAWWVETMPKVPGKSLALVVPGSLLSGFVAAMLGMRLSRCLSVNLPHGGLGILDVFENGARLCAWNVDALRD